MSSAQKRNKYLAAARNRNTHLCISNRRPKEQKEESTGPRKISLLLVTQSTRLLAQEEMFLFRLNTVLEPIAPRKTFLLDIHSLLTIYIPFVNNNRAYFVGFKDLLQPFLHNDIS